MSARASVTSQVVPQPLILASSGSMSNRNSDRSSKHDSGIGIGVGTPIGAATGGYSHRKSAKHRSIHYPPPVAESESMAPVYRLVCGGFTLSPSLYLCFPPPPTTAKKLSAPECLVFRRGKSYRKRKTHSYIGPRRITQLIGQFCRVLGLAETLSTLSCSRLSYSCRCDCTCSDRPPCLDLSTRSFFYARGVRTCLTYTFHFHFHFPFVLLSAFLSFFFNGSSRNSHERFRLHEPLC